MIKTIELLAPAKDKYCGKEAILHGADAVYIGAPKFSARSAAGNSIDDIKDLCNFAHQYNAKIYIALNTILKENELAETEQLIHELYNAGADALIIQDMGILEMNLPPIAIHASTQTDNRNTEKVKFFEQIGIEQVVLARELELNQIKDIADNTNVKLEAFVHGALCVSYSGQCYASQALTGRSANRGTCAQICRLKFDLQDKEGHSLGVKHWLSLKDLDNSAHIEDLINAGITSFKIEGRLKDIDYVKNITSYYRRIIDSIIEKRSDLKKSSLGSTKFTFASDPKKSFSRGATNYFLYGRTNDINSFETPKSRGEEIGEVEYISKVFIKVKTKTQLNNGDGLCFMNLMNQLEGFRVNRVDGNLVYPASMPKINIGTKLYRNSDEAFNKIISKPSATRKIGVDILLNENSLEFSDGTNTVKHTIETEKQIAQKPQHENIKNQLSKLGDTIFEAKNIFINSDWFFPASLLANARRSIVEKLEQERLNNAKTESSVLAVKNNIKYPFQANTYLANIANSKAVEFYKRHGVENASINAFELEPVQDAPIMFTKHCIKYSLGACPKQKTAAQISEPLHLIYKDYYLKLEFDCKLCQMLVYEG